MKKRKSLISMFLALLLIISSAKGAVVLADTADVLGIDSEQVYYIKNLYGCQEFRQFLHILCNS